MEGFDSRQPKAHSLGRAPSFAIQAGESREDLEISRYLSLPGGKTSPSFLPALGITLHLQRMITSQRFTDRNGGIAPQPRRIPSLDCRPELRPSLIESTHPQLPALFPFLYRNRRVIPGSIKSMVRRTTADGHCRGGNGQNRKMNGGTVLIVVSGTECQVHSPTFHLCLERNSGWEPFLSLDAVYHHIVVRRSSALSAICDDPQTFVRDSECLMTPLEQGIDHLQGRPPRDEQEIGKGPRNFGIRWSLARVVCRGSVQRFGPTFPASATTKSTSNPPSIPEH